ncbi:hypothetical protein [Nocardiopsis alborubida]|uniref:DUF4926 domain-containing protein n=1 Tax=Nocardiopsis alborubida TaxID=146802 RepID=A0A7X6MAM5_9ACTN|nr:hypothetical protein [Nocardiopsis alborubida]NKY96538.1 hypothetical protein [Nocardiopsis alborubida]
MFRPGDRVRTTITLTSAPSFPPEHAIPAGSLGTITSISDRGEYTVVIDDHFYTKGLNFSADEIEVI